MGGDRRISPKKPRTTTIKATKTNPTHQTHWKRGETPLLPVPRVLSVIKMAAAQAVRYANPKMHHKTRLGNRFAAARRPL